MVLAGAIAGAAFAELTLRLYVRVGGPVAARLADNDPLDVQILPYGIVGYRQRPHARFRYDNGTVATANSLGYRGPEIARAKPAGVKRIVLLGGSTTHGWGVNNDETIDAHMRLALDASGEQRFEVINAALDGYDSRQLLERLQNDVLHLEPDLVIVNSGINDVRNARFRDLVDADPRTSIWRGPMERIRHEELHGPSWWTRAKHYSLLFRLPGFVVTRIQGSAALDTAVTIHPDAADYFEGNLRQIGRLAADHDIKLIFSTPPSSIRTKYHPTAAPEKSYWVHDAETTARYRDTLAARMRKVTEELAAQGMPIRYLKPQVPPQQFLDDAHLTSQGNAMVASVFVDAALQLLRH